MTENPDTLAAQAITFKPYSLDRRDIYIEAFEQKQSVEEVVRQLVREAMAARRAKAHPIRNKPVEFPRRRLRPSGSGSTHTPRLRTPARAAPSRQP